MNTNHAAGTSTTPSRCIIHYEPFKGEVKDND
jgi:hypothetical protein